MNTKQTAVIDGLLAAQTLITEQAQRIEDLEQGMRESLANAMTCVAFWDGYYFNNGFSGAVNIGAKIKEQLRLGDLQGVPAPAPADEDADDVMDEALDTENNK